VVDGDLRRPRVHTYFGLPNGAGLSTVVSRRTALAEALQTTSCRSATGRPAATARRPVATASRSVATASNLAATARSRPARPPRQLARAHLGSAAPNPGELIASETFGQVIAELVAQSDIVLIDTPAFIPVSDAAAIAPASTAPSCWSTWRAPRGPCSPRPGSFSTSFPPASSV